MTDTTITPSEPPAPEYFWPDEPHGLWTLIGPDRARYGAVLTPFGWSVLGIPNLTSTEELVALGFLGVQRAETIAPPQLTTPPSDSAPAPAAPPAPEASDSHAQLTIERWDYLVAQERGALRRDVRFVRADFNDTLAKLRIGLEITPNAPTTLQMLARLAALCYCWARFGDDQGRGPFTYDQYRDYSRASKPYESGDA